MAANRALSIWTVFKDASDVKAKRFAARRYVVDEAGESFSDELLVSDDIDEIRREMRARGMVRLERMPGDEPQIVEVWL